MKKKSDGRMDYWHQCECGTEFQGFIHQTHCWWCIRAFIKRRFGI